MPSLKTLNHPDYEAITVKPNREVQTYPVSLKEVWCGCDKNLVRLNEKCSICGCKHKTKHRKK